MPLDPDSPKVPPHDFELEQAVLGALLLHNGALDGVRDVLRAEDFTDPDHRALFSAIVERVERGEDASAVSLRAWAEEGCKASGGTKYLARLVSASLHVGDLSRTAASLRRLSQRRALLSHAERVRASAFDESVLDVERTLQGFAADLDAIAQGNDAAGGFTTLDGPVDQALAQAERAYQGDGHLAGLSTGLRNLDSLLGGLNACDLIILAGRPSMGKTALATTIAVNNAEAGHVTGFFSLEMSSAQLATRFIGARAGVATSKLLRGTLSAAQFDEAMKAGGKIKALPLYIDQSGSLTLSQMRNRARQLKRKHGLDLIVVDYLQLIEGGDGENRTQQVTAITRGLKALAKELEVPVIALSQLSREVEKRKGWRPLLSDLRESGSIEQDADIVAFIFREEYYLANSTEPKERSRALEVAGQAEVIVAKHRNGPVATARLRFDHELMRFEDPEA
jgi:replicative DNA helicase